MRRRPLRWPSYADFVDEWVLTWPRHGGDVALAAGVFGTSPAALARRLYRAQAAGHRVRFHDTSQRADVA